MPNYISLSKEPTIFEPASTNNNVFFDPANQQIFTLRSRGAMGVNVKILGSAENLTLRIDDLGDVIDIKFSEGNTILAIQRNPKFVAFINFSDNSPSGPEYSQACKAKNASILGFAWLSATEILFITTESLEVFQLNRVKPGNCRFVRQLNISVTWFLWDSMSRVLITYSKTNHVKTVFYLKKNSSTIIEVCGFGFPADIGLECNQRSHCFLSQLYGKLYFFNLRSSDHDKALMSVHLYELKTSGAAVETDVLLVPTHEPISLSFLDNLVIIHQQKSQMSLVYDIAVSRQNSLRRHPAPRAVVSHNPVLPALSIAPCFLDPKHVPSLSANLGTHVPVELYSSSWMFTYPNLVIDCRLGCLWILQLENGHIPTLITEKDRVVDFLLNRSGAKDVMLRFCSSLSREAVETVLMPALPEPNFTFFAGGLSVLLYRFAYLFRRLAKIPRYDEPGSVCLSRNSPLATSNHLAPQGELVPLFGTQISRKLPTLVDESFVTKFTPPYTVGQNEVHYHVFQRISEYENPAVRRFFFAVLIEYIRSLTEHNLDVDHSLYEFLLATIVRLGDYDQLSYCIQNSFLPDSEPIALQLFSLESIYPLTGQLAFDMLKRLQSSDERIVDLLLLKKMPLSALRFWRMRPGLNKCEQLAKRLLQVALIDCGDDPMTFYDVFRGIQHHYASTRGSPVFTPADDCEEFKTKFVEMFGISAVVS